MSLSANSKLLFVINAGAGSKGINWQDEISNFFSGKHFVTDFLLLEGKPEIKMVEDRIRTSGAEVVVAVGGDGTVGMIAKLIANTDVTLSILPAGSANGMARELNIPEIPIEALAILEAGIRKDCDAILINDEDISIHLADVGINAQLVKYFSQGTMRGKLGYAKMMFKTLWHSQEIEFDIQVGNENIKTRAFMVILANATKYGTGAIINPDGRLDDGEFEVVIVRKISLLDILKTLYRPRAVNPEKMQVLQAKKVSIKTRHATYFQIDGEYKGKIKELKAAILPAYLKVIVPAATEQ